MQRAEVLGALLDGELGCWLVTRQGLFTVTNGTFTDLPRIHR
jgi:hypothetical protein